MFLPSLSCSFFSVPVSSFSFLFLPSRSFSFLLVPVPYFLYPFLLVLVPFRSCSFLLVPAPFVPLPSFSFLFLPSRSCTFPLVGLPIPSFPWLFIPSRAHKHFMADSNRPIKVHSTRSSGHQAIGSLILIYRSKLRVREVVDTRVSGWRWVTVTQVSQVTKVSHIDGGVTQIRWPRDRCQLDSHTDRPVPSNLFYTLHFMMVAKVDIHMPYIYI